eukprot:s121_g43.t1
MVAGQEMLALGISNLVGAAFSCYPVTGSFSRSAVNNSTGAQTQLSGVITAIVMLCTLLFLTPLFYYLPKFALAAIVMNSVIPLVALGEAKHLFHVKKHDFLLWVTAFLGTLFLGVLMGILVAVGLSLIIVIYESARPQITILWRIPGTSIYRNMKQESSGTFIQNVFIARIGSSLYFANASFVKDMLLAHVSDLDIVNKTEYIVLEMTPVISVDSSACHVIKDVVNDFRMRNMQVAFAMVGNRVDKTLRKAGLKKFIGDQWFFPTVEEAVQYCVKHQHARRVQDERSSRAASGMLTEEEKQGTAGPIDISTIQVHTGNEIGFSNDLHSSCTMVFISLVKDVPMIMSEIANVFKKNQVSIIRAQIDPSNDESGAKHIYFVRSIRTDNKLTVLEISRIREDLEVVLRRHQLINSKASGETFEVISPSHGSISNEDVQLQHSAGTDRLSRLEEAECGQFGLRPDGSLTGAFEVTKQFRVLLYQGAPFARRAEAVQRPRGPTLTVLAAAVPVVSSSSSLPHRRARRWPTGHVCVAGPLCSPFSDSSYWIRRHVSKSEFHRAPTMKKTAAAASGRRKVPRRTRTMTRLLCASAVVATANGSSISMAETRCTEVPTFPGGCDSEAVTGACYSTRTGVSWACGAPSGSCDTVPLPPPNGGAYEGYCSFAGETATFTSTSRSTSVSGTSTALTTTSSASSSSLSTSFSSTSSATGTRTLPFPPEGSPVAEYGHLRVVGTQIVSQKTGEPEDPSHNSLQRLHPLRSAPGGSPAAVETAPKVNAFRSFCQQLTEQLCLEFEREVQQLTEDVVRYRAELARCADLLAYQLGKEKQYHSMLESIAGNTSMLMGKASEVGNKANMSDPLIKQQMHQMLDQVLQGQTGALAENLGGIDEHRRLAESHLMKSSELQNQSEAISLCMSFDCESQTYSLGSKKA